MVRRTSIAVALVTAALVVPASAFSGVARHTSATQVTVRLTDARMGVSPSGLQAGSTTFVVVNGGKRAHYLQISGPGLRNVRTHRLAPGRSATLTVTLRSGAYLLALSNPAGLGMSAEHWLQVIPQATVHASGSGVVQPPPDPSSPICGGLMP
jgi:hypothetical protein